MILAVVNAIYAIAKKAWEKTHDFNGISIRDRDTGGTLYPTKL